MSCLFRVGDKFTLYSVYPRKTYQCQISSIEQNDIYLKFNHDGYVGKFTKQELDEYVFNPSEEYKGMWRWVYHNLKDEEYDKLFI